MKHGIPVLALALCAAIPSFASAIYFDTSTTLYALNSDGSATQIATGFMGARGIAVGSDGNIYVADYGAGQLDQVSGGQISEYATLTGVYGVAANGGNLLLSTFTSAGVISQVAVDGNSGDHPLTTLVSTGDGVIADLVIGPDGNLYFGSQSNSEIYDYNLTTPGITNVVSLGGDGGLAPTPRGLAFSSDGTILYYADSAALNGYGSGIYSTGQIQKLTAAGSAKGLGLDPDNGLLYFADTLSGGIWTESTTGGAPTEVNFIAGTQELFISTASAPEPGTIVMMLGGFALIGLAYRKRTA